MYEGAAVYRSYLAVAKETADRHLAQARVDHATIVIRLTIEGFAAAQAGEQEGSVRRRAIVALVFAQQGIEILGRRIGIAQVKLNDLARLHELTHRYDAGLRFDSHEVAYQEIAARVGRATLRHHDAEEQRVSK